MLRFHRHNLKKEIRLALIYILVATFLCKRELKINLILMHSWIYSKIFKNNHHQLDLYMLAAMLMEVKENPECFQNILVTTKNLKTVSKKLTGKDINMLVCKLLIIALHPWF